jgi:hypothetical protein
MVVFVMKGLWNFYMKTKQPTNLDAIKAMRRGGREAEMELLGPGFHSHNKIHKSDKIYTRKKKHKGGW